MQYVNSHDFTAMIDEDDSSTFEAVDLGPESIEFIPAEDSPDGEALIVVGHEITGTVAVLQVDQIGIGD